MVELIQCPECGDRERPGFMQDGECRECRGVRRERIDPAKYRPHKESDI